MFTIPPSNRFTVSPGDIIGWLPDGTGPAAGTLDAYATTPSRGICELY